MEGSEQEVMQAKKDPNPKGKRNQTDRLMKSVSIQLFEIEF